MKKIKKLEVKKMGFLSSDELQSVNDVIYDYCVSSTLAKGRCDIRYDKQLCVYSSEGENITLGRCYSYYNYIQKTFGCLCKYVEEPFPQP